MHNVTPMFSQAVSSKNMEIFLSEESLKITKIQTIFKNSDDILKLQNVQNTQKEQ